MADLARDIALLVVNAVRRAKGLDSLGRDEWASMYACVRRGGGLCAADNVEAVGIADAAVARCGSGRMTDLAQDVSLMLSDAICRAEGLDDPVTPPAAWAREYAEARRGGKVVSTITAEAIALADRIITAVREHDGAPNARLERREAVARAICCWTDVRDRATADCACDGPEDCRRWRDVVAVAEVAIAADEAWRGERRIKAHEMTFDPRWSVEMFRCDRSTLSDDVDDAGR